MLRRERQVLLRVSLMFIMTAAFRQVPQSTAVQHREITHLPSSANSSFVNKEFTARCAVYTLKNIDDGVVVATDDDDDVQVDYKYFVGDNS